MVTDTITLWLFLAPWGAWGVWELWLLWLRRAGPTPKPRTISMVARDYAPRLTSVVYLWGGCAAHWWWTARESAPVWAGVTFWAVAVALVAWDVALWRRPEPWPALLRAARSPLVWLVLGALAGRFLFPQTA